VFCFSDPGDAAKFMQRFGGEIFDPKLGKGCRVGAVLALGACGLSEIYQELYKIGMPRCLRHDATTMAVWATADFTRVQRTLPSPLRHL
jgi:hypothetical protein